MYDTILVRNKESGATATVPERSFVEFWQERGWERVMPAASSGTVTKPKVPKPEV